MAPQDGNRRQVTSIYMTESCTYNDSFVREAYARLCLYLCERLYIVHNDSHAPDDAFDTCGMRLISEKAHSML